MVSPDGVLCVVQARTGSSRLPGKVLADLGGRPMLAFMLDRLRDLPFPVVVATSDLDRDDAVVDLAASCGVDVVRGSERDVLERFGQTVDRFGPETVVRLTADCPLVDPALVAAVVDLHRERQADYTCNVLPRTFPKGLDVEVSSAAALLVARREATVAAEREHVMPFLYRRPERFRLANLRSGLDLGHERWTVDTAADLARLRELVQALHGREAFGWRDVLAVAGTTPATTPGELRLRPAEVADADLLLRWRNDPDAVRFSGSRQPVTPVEHRGWLAARLSDPGSQIWIAVVDDESVGSVRVDIVDALGEVSIAVDRSTRGRGVGSRALAALQRHVLEDQQLISLRAAVDPGNVASARLFAKAGFVPSGRRGDFVLYTWESGRSDQHQEAGQ